MCLSLATGTKRLKSNACLSGVVWAFCLAAASLFAFVVPGVLCLLRPAPGFPGSALVAVLSRVAWLPRAGLAAFPLHTGTSLCVCFARAAPSCGRCCMVRGPGLYGPGVWLLGAGLATCFGVAAFSTYFVFKSTSLGAPDIISAELAAFGNAITSLMLLHLSINITSLSNPKAIPP